jgi:excisionase family DNA binding protein
MSSQATLTAPLTLTEVCEIVGVTRLTLMRWCAQGKFPPPLPIGIRRRLWNPSDVQRALASGGRSARATRGR